MTGHPGDPNRKGRMTSTFNCWTLQSTIASPYIGTYFNLYDTSSLHNCSTYGGNSGGPLYLEGTNIAIGLPYTYRPHDFNLRDPWDLDTAAYLAQIGDFVTRNRQKLNQAGITIVESLPSHLNFQPRPLKD